MSELRYILQASEVGASLAKAQKLLERGQVKGLDGGYTVAVEERTITNEFGAQEAVFELVVTGEPYRLNGWQLAGSVEWLPNGEAVFGMAPDFQGQEFGDEFIKPNQCDYCQTNRDRKTQVIVVNEQNEFKVVGSTCTKDFLGWKYSPSFLRDLTEEFDREFGIGSEQWSVYTPRVIEIALAVVNANGYVKANAYEVEKRSTKDTVSIYLSDPKALSPEAVQFDAVAGQIVSGQFAQEAVTVLAKAREMVEAGEGDYFRNLKSALTGDRTFFKTLGLIVSVVPVVKREEWAEARKLAELAEKTEREGEVSIQTQFAEDGAKIILTGAKVTDKGGYAGAYGWVSIYTFVAEGARFKWFCTGSFDAEIGDVVNLKATVKGFDTYNGVNSTLLTRCSENKPKLTKAEKLALANVEFEL